MPSGVDEKGRLRCKCGERLPIGAEAGYKCQCGQKHYFIPACVVCGIYMLQSDVVCRNCGQEL